MGKSDKAGRECAGGVWGGVWPICILGTGGAAVGEVVPV